MRLLILMVSFRKVYFITISPDFLSCQFFDFDHNPPLNYVDCGSVILLQVSKNTGQPYLLASRAGSASGRQCFPLRCQWPYGRENPET